MSSPSLLDRAGLPLFIGFCLGAVFALVMMAIIVNSSTDARLEDKPKADLIADMSGGGLFRYVDTDYGIVIYRSRGQLAAAPLKETR